VSGYPNFFIAGAPKSGSTSLHHYLSQHPQIFMSPVKEPTYFGKADLLSGWWRERTLRQLAKERPVLRSYLDGPMSEEKWLLVLDRDEYRRLFRNASDEIAVGEASVSYYWLSSSAAAIRATIPDARLIFVLRDPAEMAFSMYLASLAEDPSPSFRARFLASANMSDMWHQVVEAPKHATNLTRFLDLFPRKQISIYLYEDFRERPREMLHDIFEFLGVRPDYPVDLSEQRNVPRIPRNRRLHALRLRLFGRMPLRSLLPPPIRDRVLRWYARPRAEVRMEAADRRMVIDHYRAEIERTAELVARDLSAWLR
jgi:hypothetical protein